MSDAAEQNGTDVTTKYPPDCELELPDGGTCGKPAVATDEHGVLHCVEHVASEPGVMSPIDSKWSKIDDEENVLRYGIPENIKEQIEKSFVYHTPKDDQPERYVTIRAEAKELAMTIASCAPASRELSLALTHLEQAVMFANAAIARNE